MKIYRRNKNSSEDRGGGDPLVEDLLGINDQDCRLLVSEGNILPDYSRNIFGTKKSSSTPQTAFDQFQPWSTNRHLLISSPQVIGKPSRSLVSGPPRIPTFLTKPSTESPGPHSKLNKILKTRPSGALDLPYRSIQSPCVAFRLSTVNLDVESMREEVDNTPVDQVQSRDPRTKTIMRRTFAFSRRNAVGDSEKGERGKDRHFMLSGFQGVQGAVPRMRVTGKATEFQSIEDMKISAKEFFEQKNRDFISNILQKTKSQESCTKLNKNPYFLGAMRRMLSDSSQGSAISSNSWRKVEKQRGILIVQKKTKGSDTFKRKNLLEKQVDLRQATKDIRKRPIQLSLQNYTKRQSDI